MLKISIQYHKIPFGELILGSFEDRLCLCDWRFRKKRNKIDQRLNKALATDFCEEPTEIIRHAKHQIDEYLSGTRKEFNIPLLLIGTDFQKAVWNVLLKIPFGKTETYLGLSRKLGNEKSISSSGCGKWGKCYFNFYTLPSHYWNRWQSYWVCRRT